MNEWFYLDFIDLQSNMGTIHFKHVLFVYGLLRKGSNDPMALFLDQQASFIDHGYLHGKLFMVDGYPGAVAMLTSEKVYGDVFGFDDETLLAKLDDFEEINMTDEYIRSQVDIHTASGLLNCWMYVYNRPTTKLKQIVSGDFLKYLSELKMQ